MKTRSIKKKLQKSVQTTVHLQFFICSQTWSSVMLPIGSQWFQFDVCRE